MPVLWLTPHVYQSFTHSNQILHLRLLRNENSIESRRKKNIANKTKFIHKHIPRRSRLCSTPKFDVITSVTKLYIVQVQQTVLTNCTYHVIWLSAPREKQMNFMFLFCLLTCISASRWTSHLKANRHQWTLASNTLHSQTAAIVVVAEYHRTRKWSKYKRASNRTNDKKKLKNSYRIHGPNRNINKHTSAKTNPTDYRKEFREQFSIYAFVSYKKKIGNISPRDCIM